MAGFGRFQQRRGLLAPLAVVVLFSFLNSISLAVPSSHPRQFGKSLAQLGFRDGNTISNQMPPLRMKSFPSFIPDENGIPVPLKVRRQDDCSDYLTEMIGEFSSPNYPSDYPNNAVCTWEIEVPSDYKIRLTFKEFRLETSSDCHKDFVEVYDGNGFHLFCGRDKPPAVETVTNVMSVVFISDGEIHVGNKFLAEYTAFQGTGGGTTPEGWTGRTTTESNIKTTTQGGGGGDGNCTASIDVTDPTVWGFFMTPNHPGNYPSGTKCSWEILSTWEQPAGRKLQRRKANKSSKEVVFEPETRIGFLRFKTGASDVVSLFDGNGESPNTAVDTAQGDLMTDNLNHTLAAKTFRRASSNLTVTFSGSSPDSGLLMFLARDLPLTAKGQPTLKDRLIHASKKPSAEAKKPAFKNLREMAIKNGKVIKINTKERSVQAPEEDLQKLAKFSEKHGRRQDEPDYGHFISPNHPEFYNNEETLLYTITAPASQRVAIYFARFDTETNRDWVVLKEAGMEDEIYLSADGHETDVFSHVYISQTNEVEAVFHADQTIARTGFLAAFAAVTVS